MLECVAGCLNIARCRLVCEITLTYGYVFVARSSLTDSVEVVGKFTVFFCVAVEWVGKYSLLSPAQNRLLQP